MIAWQVVSLSYFSAKAKDNGIKEVIDFAKSISRNNIKVISKLMLIHITSLIAAGIGYYGTAISVSQRYDLSAQYT